MKILKTLSSIIICAVLIILPLNLTVSSAEPASTGTESLVNGKSMREDSYEVYLNSYKDAPMPEDEIVISGADYKNTDMDVEILDDYMGSEGKSVLTGEDGFIEYEFDVRQEGLYNIEIEYYPIKGKGAAIERELQINNQVPFSGAKHILLSRVFTNGESVRRDNRGNDIRPRQVESPMWMKSELRDFMGYYNEPYYFYFSKGRNSIKLISVKEPLVIKSIRLFQQEKIPTYEDMKNNYAASGLKPAVDQFILIEGEDASYKSDPTLYPTNDRSSPATSEYHPSKIRLNTIGGYLWAQPNQWLTWEFEVDEPGLYKIAIKSRQNIVRGIYTNRRFLLDGKVPFKELKAIPFTYDANWKMNVLGGEDEPYLFYLDKGKHTIRMETTLGDFAEILRIVEESVYHLNNVYRKILMITGNTPDINRDYLLDKQIPNEIEMLGIQSKVLSDVSKQLQEYTGQRGSDAAILDRLSLQLADLYDKPHTIPARLSNFKSNVGALSTWVMNTREQPLEIDYIVVASPEKELPKAEAGFLAKVVHEVKAFFASFVEDYTSIGDQHSGKEAITVWVATGRDQAQILKMMIDDQFSQETGIPVNLQIISQGVLLPATVAKRGPDVALNLGVSDPVNFATRNAVAELTQFPDFAEIAKRFHPSALVPFTFRSKVYALPETQTFPMMFYRTDILEELGLEVPETWDDVFLLIPELQKNNMDFVIPVSTTVGAGGGLTSFATLLFQQNGQIYKEDGIASALDEEIAIQVFQKWTGLYSNYKLPLAYDFANRFRVGEVPIGIADYSTYNLLTVFAPEIKGLWDFAPVPGTVQENGEINRATPSTGLAAVIMEDSDQKQESWEFLKWWTKSEVQLQFGQEMESLLGAAARYPTANQEALELLPWPYKDYMNLKEQWKWVRGIPEVPGGYFTTRHLDNAFRAVVYNGDDPRETLLDYVRVINEEITSKRIEFGLETIQ